MKNKFATWALFAVGLAVPVALVTGSVYQYILKSSNPNNIVISGDLAYLKPAMTAGLVLGGALIVLSVVLTVVSAKNKEEPMAYRMSAIALVSVLLLTGSLIVIDKKSTELEKEKTTTQMKNFLDTIQKKAADKKK